MIAEEGAKYRYGRNSFFYRSGAPGVRAESIFVLPCYRRIMSVRIIKSYAHNTIMCVPGFDPGTISNV